MEKIIKQYECGQELMADDLNDIISLGNDIILYIKDHESGWENNGGNGNNVQISSIGNEGKRIAKYKIDNNPEGYIYAPTTTPGLNGDVTIIEPVDFTGSKVHIANYTAGNGSGKLYAPAPGSGEGGNGQNGLDGLSTLFAFKGFANDRDAELDWDNNFKNSRNYPPGINDGWSTSSNVSLQTGHMLYMTTAQRLGNSYITVDGVIWLKPVRIGSDGSTSTTGTDDDDYNYIYSRTIDGASPPLSGSTQTNKGVDLLNWIEAESTKTKGYKPSLGLNNPIDIPTAPVYAENGRCIDKAWTDHPYGVSSQLPFEWQTGFKKNATSGNWEYYFGPVIISHYGHDGLDGDGLEYIFYLLAKNLAGIPSLGAPYDGSVTKNGTTTNYTNVLVNSSDYQLDDFIPTGWHDSPQEISEEYPRQYVSTRKKEGSLEAGNLWQAFTTPRLWNVYATNGFLATLDNDTIIFDDDTDHDAIEYVSLTKEFLWDGANDVTLSNNYTSVTVTINCVGFSSELRPGIASIDSNGDVSVSDNTDWGTPMEINRSNYTGFALTKREGVGKLETKTGSITYTIRAYESGNDTPKIEASRILTILVVDINDGTAYSLQVTPNTLGVSRTNETSPYTLRDAQSITVTATAASGKKVENITIKNCNDSNDIQNIEDNNLYVEVKDSEGNLLGISPLEFTNTKSLVYTIGNTLNGRILSTGNNAILYIVVDLYYKYLGQGIKIDSETVDFSVKGDKGQDGSGTESYVVTSLNDNAVIDDLTVDENALKAATLNTLTVYKGSANVTEECSFIISNSDLPKDNNTNILIPKVDGADNKLYLGYASGYSSINVSSFPPGNYYYDVAITTASSPITTKRFKLYVDANISSDGSFYKLSVTNDIVNYDSEGNSLSDSNIVISAYKISLDGTSTKENIISKGTSSPSSSDGLYVEFDSSSLNKIASLSNGEITISRISIPYNANGYDVTLYNGSSYVDGPEHIDCIKDGAPGGSGNDGQDSVVYNLEPYPTVLKFNVASDGNTLTPSELVARCKISKKVGNNDYIFSNDNIDGYFLYYNITTSDGQLVNISGADVGSYVIYNNSDKATAGIHISNLDLNYTSVNFYLAKWATNMQTTSGNLSYTTSLTPVKQIYVPILRDGLKGESGEDSTGLVGKFYYFAGDWTENSLTVTEHLYPYVYYNGDYWMFIGEYNPNNETDNDTYKKPVDNLDVWEKITYNKFLISEAMFAKYAQLGALIVNRDWMISQYGTYNGSPSWSAYVNFDPIAFMTYLRPNEGASIGVIPRTNGSNLNLPSSLMFLIRLTADITVTVTGTTKLIEVSEYKSDNSLSINYENNQIKYGFENSGTATISNYNSNKWYCFVGGQVSDIKIKYSNVISNTNIFIPNFAVDLRSGLTYLNNAYIKGLVSTVNDLVVLKEESQNLSNWATVSDRGLFCRNDVDTPSPSLNEVLASIGVHKYTDNYGYTILSGEINLRRRLNGSSNWNYANFNGSGLTFAYHEGNSIPNLTEISALDIKTKLVIAPIIEGAYVFNGPKVPVAFPGNIIIGSGIKNLPSNPLQGTIVFAKGTEGNMAIKGNGKDIMTIGNNKIINESPFNIYSISYIFVYDGTRWIAFCGDNN